MSPVKLLIIDDNPHCREEINYLLQPYRNMKVVGQAETGIEGLEMTREFQPEAVFLDIEMPHLSGMEYAEIVRREYSIPPKIVFVTAYIEYAFSAFKFQPIHFLSKPIERCAFSTAVSWIMDSVAMYTGKEFRNRENDRKIEIKGKESTTYLDPQEVFLVSHKDSITTAHTVRGKYETSATLSEIESKLNSHLFCRTHKNYIFNCSYKSTITITRDSRPGCGLMVFQDCDFIVPISRTYFRDLVEKLRTI